MQFPCTVSGMSLYILLCDLHFIYGIYKVYNYIILNAINSNGNLGGVPSYDVLSSLLTLYVYKVYNVVDWYIKTTCKKNRILI